MNTLRNVAAVALLLVSVTACKPAQQKAPGAAQHSNVGAASARNPCEIVSTAELAGVVATTDGVPVAVTKTAEAGEFQGRKCEWEYPKKELVTDVATVGVTAWKGQQYYTPDVLGGFTEVAGVGDAAHSGPSMFMFRKGDDVFLVMVLGDANAGALRPAIAKLILTKL